MFFLRAIFRWWFVLLTGGVLAFSIAAIEHWLGRSLSWLVYAAILLVGLFVACVLALREEHQKRVQAEERLAQTRPLFLAERHEVTHSEIVSAMPSEMADPYRFRLLLVLTVEPSRRPALGTDGRLILASHDLVRQPSINIAVDGGYGETRIFNLGPTIQVGPNASPHFIALELRYADPETHERHRQAWYWRWEGSTKDGVFLSDVASLSKADTDRFIPYLKNLGVAWGD